MQYTKLGRTNLNVSVVGLGCGGRSQLGLSRGLGDENAIRIIRKALDSGVNFFDTAAIYRTEKVLGKGLRDVNRDDFILSSKFSPANFSDTLSEKRALTKSLDKSLNKLKVDHIDVFHLHGVHPSHYEEARDRFYPELIKAQEKGKIRFTGITEYFGKDTNHKMAEKALEDGIWDVLMVGYSMLNPSARKKILPLAIKKNIGTLDMFAVRTALSKNERLIEIIDELHKQGKLDKTSLSTSNPLDFLLENNEASSITEAAYRFCRHTDGMDVVLTGTASVDHLKDNINSILKPPLTKEMTDKILDIFGDIDSVSGQ